MADIDDDVTATVVEQKTAANLKNTEANSASIKTAAEKIDNQEDSITYLASDKQNVDGYVINAPGAGKFIRVHHIYCNNAGANVTRFQLEEKSDGVVYIKWDFCLAANGGAVAQNLKRPWDLPVNYALHYDWISGANAVISITIGYEIIDV